MPISESRKRLLEAREKLTPEQRTKVEQLAARTLATEMLRAMQRAAEEAKPRPAGTVERNGADQEGGEEPTKGR